MRFDRYSKSIAMNKGLSKPCDSEGLIKARETLVKIKDRYLKMVKRSAMPTMVRYFVMDSKTDHDTWQIPLRKFISRNACSV